MKDASRLQFTLALLAAVRCVHLCELWILP